MSEVSELSLKTVGKVALLGSDIPTLTVEDLDEVFSKRLNKSSYFFPTKDGGFCLMISNSQNVVHCLSKIKSSTTSVMQTFTKCLGEVEFAKKIFNDVDVILDLRKVYIKLKQVEEGLSDEQKDLLNFLRINKKFFI
jgi:glycosyltransferase A (GT-A) superfamily protein (DUF2064 family)